MSSKTLDSVKIVDHRIYFITEFDVSPFHEGSGWYCDLIYSDDKIDTYGPYDTERQAVDMI